LSLKRKPAEITYLILKNITTKGEVTKEDISKIAKTKELDSYLRFLVRNNFISEIRGFKQPSYVMAKKGEELYQILRKDQIFKTIIKIGKKEHKRENFL